MKQKFKIPFILFHIHYFERGSIRWYEKSDKHNPFFNYNPFPLSIKFNNNFVFSIDKQINNYHLNRLNKQFYLISG